MPFLTQLDPRARIKGSRDPLGFQSIWTRLGRQVVQNLTTVTTSVRGFTTLVLGLYFAEQLVDQRNANETDFVNLFLKFEQLAAYSRVSYSADLNDDVELLGIRRAKRNLLETQGKVRISVNQEDQILANQKTYGLWGLYTVAARNSGLVEPGYARLTPAARDFVERHYLPQLSRVESGLYAFLLKDQVFEPKKKHAALGSTLARILGPQLSPAEVAFYTRQLLFSGEETTLQRRLWEQIKAVNTSDPFSMPELREVIQRCQTANDTPLGLRLEHIRQVEQVIAPVSFLFGYLLSQDGQPAASLAHNVSAGWPHNLDHLDPAGFAQALDSVEDLEPDTRTRLTSLAETLQAGRYAETIDLLLAQNKAVMQERNSNPWLLFKNGQLDVRLQEEVLMLPPKAELPYLWLNTYFINSLKEIGRQLN